MLIWCSRNILFSMLKTFVLLNIFVENIVFFSGFFDYKVQKKTNY